MSFNKKDISANQHSGANRTPMMQQHGLGQPTYTYVGGNNAERRTFDLFKILSTLFHRKWTVLLVTLFFSLLALFITLQMKPAYKASGTLEIARKSHEVVQFGKVSSTGEDNEFYHTQYGLLTNPALARRVIKELKLTAAQLSGKKTNSSNLLKNKTIEELFLARLTVSPTPKSRLVTVSFENANPRLASQITNALLSNFIQSNIDKKRGVSSYTQEYLTNRVNEVKQKLEDSELQLDNFASKNKIIKFDESQTVKLKVLERLEGMLAEAEKERIDAESNRQQIQESGGKGIQNVMNNPVIQALKQQKVQLLADYQEMLQTFKPTYPLMVQLKNRLNQITREISQEKNAIINDTRIYASNSYEASRAKVNKLEGKVSRLKEELMVTQNKTVEYDTIKRKVFSYQDLYTTLLKRLNEVTVAGNATINNISIISKATVPRKKIKPRRLLNLVAGTLLGLFTGSLLALFLEVTRGRIRSESDLEQVANLPILGKIPKIKSRSGRVVSLLIHSKNHPPLAEAIRSFRTNLTHAVGQKPPNSILFTSPSEGEGKTSTAINLACAYVMMGKTVLLIDADMRNPSIDKRLLKSENKVGLSSYLSGHSNLAEITTLSRVPRLFVIPAGDRPKNPVELLASKKMADLIKLGEQKFDVVIVDSPPVRDISDSIVLSKFVDTTLLTVKINKTEINEMSHALSRLEKVSDNLLGVVATNTKQQYYRHGKPQRFPVLAKI